MAAVGAAAPVPGGVTDVVGLTSVLQSAQSPDATLRGQAEQHLQQLRENNHAQLDAAFLLRGIRGRSRSDCAQRDCKGPSLPRPARSSPRRLWDTRLRSDLCQRWHVSAVGVHATATQDAAR